MKVVNRIVFKYDILAYLWLLLPRNAMNITKIVKFRSYVTRRRAQRAARRQSSESY